jgi:hypothetical protein
LGAAPVVRRGGEVVDVPLAGRERELDIIAVE